MATTWCDMPGDILISILSRLPVKSLVRFRCVCKSWHALFSDPNFMDIHLNQTCANNKEGYVLIHHQERDEDKLSIHCDETFVEHTVLELPFNRSYRSFAVEGYCRGLLCLSCPLILPSPIYLWNPAIRKLKALPCSLSPFFKMYIAFGFVPQINDYRVLKFRYDVSSYGLGLKVPSEVEIYSLSTNSWKVIQNVVPYMIRSCCCPQDSVVNGVVHWVARMTMVHNTSLFILSFDMDREVFGEIKLPECSREDIVLEKAAMVDSLSLFVCSQVGDKKRLVVWVMKEYGVAESWIKQFTFDWPVYLLSPFLGFMKNGEVVLRDRNGELVLCDPRAQQVKKIQIRGVGYIDIFYYVESLVLLNEGN
ncbi:hypothetical protein L1049_025179 [Liquidambar formosana]|uniref:F-box domain-containing protein n=1 Tax=Liquidambar formosana TaxID=63359 RepID=A0AAP0S273_LIQFO